MGTFVIEFWYLLPELLKKVSANSVLDFLPGYLDSPYDHLDRPSGYLDGISY